MYLTFGAGQAAAGAGLAESHTWNFTFPPIKEPWLLPVWFYQVHTGNMFAYPNGGHAPGSIATFVLFVIGCIAMWRENRTGLFLLLGPLPLMFIAAAMEKYPYGGSARVAQHFAPAVCLLAGFGLLATLRWFFSGRQTVDAMRIALIVFVVVILVGIGRDFYEPFKKRPDTENKRVMRKLAGQTPDDATWVVFGSMDDVGHVPHLVVWGGSAARFRFNVFRFAPVEVLWGPTEREIATIQTDTVWVLAYEDNKGDIQPQRLNNYLALFEARYRKVGEHEHLLHDVHDGDEAIRVYRFEATKN